ncbi:MULTISPECIES: DUF4386 family protein [unclassified Pseudonocardia]|uniref:DUF4386 family protein n=1 Tax=unclassified Pseudonocardia TaxID=2619320 RepID=UPI0001FFE564|nr:DUF4386 family protein [Pseudonocardia sp. Ae707_Ps1]
MQIFCASCGLAMLLLLFGGLVAAGWVPPVAPSESAETVASRFVENANGIRVGMILILFGATCTVPFGGLLAAHMKQIEGRFSPLTYVQIACTASGLLVIALPALVFVVAAYRPGRDPQLLLLLSDLGWISFIMNGGALMLQTLSFGTAVLLDRRVDAPFPRWLGYFGLWAAFCFLPAFVLVFFTTGPFAWNGLLSFWLAAALFGGWFLVCGAMLIRAASRPLRSTPVADPVAVP